MCRPKAAALFVVAAVAAVALTITIAAQESDAVQAPGVLLSRQLMEARRLHVGDLVRLAADPLGGRSRSFRVLGYEPTPDPMRFAQPALEARLHLADLLALTAEPSDANAADAAGAINVALVNPSASDRFARDVAARLPGTVATPTAAPNERTSTFLVIERFHFAVAIVTMIGSAVFLLALMMMMVDERRETLGTLRVIGLTRRRILLQVFAEGTVIAAVGTGFGILLAFGSQGAFNRFFQWRDTALVFVRITPEVVAQSMALAVPLGIVASLAAAWTELRRHPLALIRR